MRKLTESHGFELISLAFVAIAVLWWILVPKANAWPMVIALIPWGIRLAARKFPFCRTKFDLPIWLFLLTAGIGVWAAYDQDLAFRKFFLILGAILAFYAIADQNIENIFFIIINLSLYGVLTTGLFLLSHDWLKFPADLAIINTIGTEWMSVRPDLNFEKLSEFEKVSANIAGGINAMLLPLCVAAIIHYWQKRKTGSLIFLLIMTGVLVFGLLLSSSRAAWGATILGFGFLFLLNFSKTREVLLKRGKFLVALTLLILLSGILLPMSLVYNKPELESHLADITSFSSRLEIAKNTLYLISDYPFTGGGLGSFPGLYSQYILVIPFFIFNYSHNLFLDIILEQGFPGFIAFGAIIFLCAKNISAVFAKKKLSDSKSVLLATSIYSSLIIVLFHGLADNPIYSNFWGLPLLLILPGFSTAISKLPTDIPLSVIPLPLILSVGSVLLLAIIVIFHKPLLATWHANLGAVLMSKIELENWPTNEWIYWEDTKVFESAQAQFSKALSLDPGQSTANYRLGLIEMAHLDFQNASDDLETSIKAAPEHRGIKKTLGYCYIWLGEFEKAEFYLKQIPEVMEEIQTYSWWWETKNQDILAGRASAFLSTQPSFGIQP